MSPWKMTWRSLPPYLRQALEEEDITNDDADGPSFARMWERHLASGSETISAALNSAKALQEKTAET